MAVLTLPMAVTACNSSTVQKAPADAGTSRSFDASYDQVKQAAVDALVALRVPPSKTEEQPGAFTILVSRAPHGFSWGEVGRVTVEKTATPPVLVRVVYEKRMPLQFGGSESGFARNLFAKMDQQLAIKPAN